MDNQKMSSNPSSSTVFSAKSTHEVVEKTVAHLLDDKAAMDDWKSNIEKIRQKESEGSVSPNARQS